MSVDDGVPGPGADRGAHRRAFSPLANRSQLPATPVLLCRLRQHAVPDLLFRTFGVAARARVSTRPTLLQSQREDTSPSKFALKRYAPADQVGKPTRNVQP